MTPRPTRDWFRSFGPAYLRKAINKGIQQEVEFLVDTLALEPGVHLLDVGCGPGEHALRLARRGIEVTGVDLSPDDIDRARAAAAARDLPARFEVGDLRDLAYDSEFDAAICLCQGGFGLLGDDDDAVLVERIVRAVRPGGGVAVTAFSSYYVLRRLEEDEEFDPATGVLHEVSTARNEHGDERDFDAWTTCFTARELSLIAEEAGLRVTAVHGFSPGLYRTGPVTLGDAELLLLGRRKPA